MAAHWIRAPQLLQNFSPCFTGFPHAVQTRSPEAGATGAGAVYCGGGGGEGGRGCTGAVAGISGTFTRHRLQNLSAGARGFPHALQTSPPGDEAAGCGGDTAGGGGGEAAAGAGSRTGAFAMAGAGGAAAAAGAGSLTVTGAGISGTFTRHRLQNLSAGARGFPHALQTRPPAGDATGAGDGYRGGGGGEAAAGAGSRTGALAMAGAGRTGFPGFGTARGVNNSFRSASA